MNRALLAIAAMATAGAALGQGTQVYVPVRTIADQGISLMGWGSGTISETDEVKFEGSYSLRVTTRNLFQGGLMRLSKPVDLAGDFTNKDNLLRVAIRVADMNMTMGGGSPRGGGGDLGAAGAPVGPAGQGAPPGGGALGSPAKGGNPGGQNTGATGSTPIITPLTMVRFVVTTTDGLKSEAYVPISTSGGGDKGWRSVAIPLQAIRGFERSNKIIKEVGVSGNALSTFYIGEMRVINDATPITSDVNPKTMNLALNDEREFRATGFGGSSVLRYTWDFDARDGIQVDAEGQVIRRKFRKPGDFTVTLTVSDASGLKKSHSSTIQVRVNP